MISVVIKEPLDLELVNKEMPIPGEGEALLKILYAGICGSDSSVYVGGQPFASYPRIPGHEFSAEIIDIGDNNLGLEPKMIVTAVPYFNCGHCYPCKNGKINCCEDNQTMGVQRDGAFEEYIVMPIERIIPGKGLSPDLLALVEPFSISYHAVKRGDVQKGDHVLVVGGGPIGLFAMVAAKMKGAKVYVADRLQKRLEMALDMGADGIINVTTEDLEGVVHKITGGNGMDICIEAAGVPETFLSCIENACFGGKIILIGNGKRETLFNHSILLKKELNVYGSRNSLNSFEEIIDLFIEDHSNVKKIVTHVYELENVKEAFEDLKNNEGSMAKVLVKF